MHRKWDTIATWSREFLSTEDPQGEPGFELVIRIHCTGESHDGAGANDPEAYGYEDRELVEAYLSLHPDNIRIELPRDIQTSLYAALAASADSGDLSYPITDG